MDHKTFNQQLESALTGPSTPEQMDGVSPKNLYQQEWYAVLEEIPKSLSSDPVEGGRLLVIGPGESPKHVLIKYLREFRLLHGRWPDWYTEDKRYYSLTLGFPQTVSGNTISGPLYYQFNLPKLNAETTQQLGDHEDGNSKKTSQEAG